MTQNDPAKERLHALEELGAHQAKTIEELSTELAEMAKDLREMQTRLDVLTRRLVSMEENISDIAPDTKPPHW
ncbi:MAG: SlyX family protein [Pseudomonadota bacterium]